jgi:hypothetical protein
LTTGQRPGLPERSFARPLLTWRGRPLRLIRLWEVDEGYRRVRATLGSRLCGSRQRTLPRAASPADGVRRGGSTQSLHRTRARPLARSRPHPDSDPSTTSGRAGSGHAGHARERRPTPVRTAHPAGPFTVAREGPDSRSAAPLRDTSPPLSERPPTGAPNPARTPLIDFLPGPLRRPPGPSICSLSHPSAERPGSPRTALSEDPARGARRPSERRSGDAASTSPAGARDPRSKAPAYPRYEPGLGVSPGSTRRTIHSLR